MADRPLAVGSRRRGRARAWCWRRYCDQRSRCARSWIGLISVVNKCWISLPVRGIRSADAGWSRCSAAAVTARNAWASMARVTQRCQEGSSGGPGVRPGQPGPCWPVRSPPPSSDARPPAPVRTAALDEERIRSPQPRLVVGGHDRQMSRQRQHHGARSAAGYSSRPPTRCTRRRPPSMETRSAGMRNKGRSRRKIQSGSNLTSLSSNILGAATGVPKTRIAPWCTAPGSMIAPSGARLGGCRCDLRESTVRQTLLTSPLLVRAWCCRRRRQCDRCRT